MFFDLLPPKAFAISNTDDKNGMYIMQNTKAKKIYYALKRAADYQAKILEQQFSGMLLKPQAGASRANLRASTNEAHSRERHGTYTS